MPGAIDVSAKSTLPSCFCEINSPSDRSIAGLIYHSTLEGFNVTRGKLHHLFVVHYPVTLPLSEQTVPHILSSALQPPGIHVQSTRHQIRRCQSHCCSFQFLGGHWDSCHFYSCVWTPLTLCLSLFRVGARPYKQQSDSGSSDAHFVSVGGVLPFSSSGYRPRMFCG